MKISFQSSFLVLCSLAACAGLSEAKSLEASRPNIIYFYVDDMGWGSIGPNGQAERCSAGLPSVRTPHLDSLASNGINFTRGYGCTVCSPSRSSQQTGFHQGHTFADRNDPDNAKKAIRRDDIAMGDALSKAGYATGYWGKWGYGGSKDKAAPTIDNIQTLPTSHGYQHVLAELHHVRAHTFFQPTLWHAPAKEKTESGLDLLPNSMAPYVGDKNYPAQPANHNHPDYPATGYCDDLYVTHCLDFVRKNARVYNETGRPFFALLGVQIPHAPFGEIERLPEWDIAYKDDKHFPNLSEQSRQWAAMVTRIDAHFGNILAALDDPDGDGNPSDSVADNTLVIFMSDNGGPGGKSNTEFDANGGLRGNKGSIQEGGIRVPTIMRWPAKITASSKLKAGTNSNLVVDITDLLPTFCELAGADIPLGLDGVSIAPTLTGEGNQRLRDFIIHEAGNGQSIIRGRHKLVRNVSKKGKDVSFALYNLEEDHSESNDISGSNKELVAELKALLLGERVTEDRGFANTYHHWTGKDGARTSDADNWSDYEYANAGITYIGDDGAPRLSWNTLMENRRKTPATAIAEKDLEVLAIEIRGSQELALAKNVNVTGRNEIRLSKGATLTLNGGTLSSLRWVDVKKGATLRGKGQIDGNLYNQGAIDLTLTGSDPILHITGTAHLGGTLEVTLGENFVLANHTQFALLTARHIEGRFNNHSEIVTASDGTTFRIHYSSTAVTLATLE